MRQTTKGPLEKSRGPLCFCTRPEATSSRRPDPREASRPQGKPEDGDVFGAVQGTARDRFDTPHAIHQGLLVDM